MGDGHEEAAQGAGGPAREARRGAARMGAAAALLAASVLLSRLTGFVREAVHAAQVGAGAAMDAYRAAFTLPDLLNYLLAGSALSIAFIPLYTRARETRGEAAAARLFATVLGTATLLALVLTAALWWWAEPLTALQFGAFDPETRALTARLTRIVLPAQVFFVAGGVIKAVLMARGRFGAQAAAPVVYNLSIIGFGLALGPQLGVEGFAWGALVGAALGSFAIAWWDARRHVGVGWRFAARDAEFLHYLVVAAPLMLGLSLLTVDEWYDRWFGATLGEGAVARLGYARQLMLVPVAVVGQATAAAALPTLARLFSQGRREELDRTLLRTLQLALAAAILAAAGLFATAGPLVQVVYQRGAFRPEDGAAVAVLLQVMCFAVPAWVVQQIGARAFYARGDTWRPMLLGTLTALAAVPLYLALGRRAGPPGLAAAGALAMSANALATLLWARRRHGAPQLTSLAASGVRALGIAAVAAGGAWALQPGAPGALGALADLAVAAAVFAAASVLGVRLVGDAALREVLALAARRLRRR